MTNLQRRLKKLEERLTDAERPRATHGGLAGMAYLVRRTYDYAMGPKRTWPAFSLRLRRCVWSLQDRTCSTIE